MIWNYIKSKSQTKQGIADLAIDPNNPEADKTDDDEEKANILTSYFSSMFTQEPAADFPRLPDKDLEAPLSKIIITEEQIQK